MSNLPNLNSFRKDSTEKSFYSIVEFSEITNLAKNTLRSLEKEFGLEVLRDAKGNRVYTSSDIERFLYAFNLRGNEHNSNSNPQNTSSNQSLNEAFSLLPSSKPPQQISEIAEQREFKTPKFLKLLKTLSNPLKNLNLASLLSFPIIVSTFLSVFAFSSLNDFLDAPRNLELFPSNTKSQNTASVLQSTSDIYEYRFDVNIPAYFNSTVNISGDLTTQGNITSTGNAIFNTASFQNIEVGEVTITPTGISAPNIVNSLNLEDGEDNLVLDNDDPNNPVLSLNTNLNLSELTVDTLNSSTLNGITEIDAESAQTIQQAINFSTDAITLNGLSSDNFLRSNTSTTYSGGVFGLSSGASFEALSGSSLTIKQGSLFEVSSGATFKFSNVPANSYLKVDSSGNLSYFNINAGNNITITTSPNSVVITGVDPSILDSLAVGTLFFGPSHEEQYRLLPSLSELNKLYTLAGSILSSSNITSFYPNLDTDATNDLIISTLASSNVYSINTWYGFQDFTRISAFNTEIEQNGSIKFTSGAVPTSYSGRLYYSSNRMFFEELPIAMYYDSTYDHLGKLAQFETDASGRLLLRGTSELSIDLFESGAPNQILGAVPLGGGGTSTEYVSIGGDLSMSISGTLASYTLNTVNTNPGTFGGEYYIPIVTVDGKGRVTAVTTTPNANVFPNYITNISFSTPSPAHRTFILERAGFSDAYATFSLAPVDITTALNYTPLNKAGDTMSGSLLVQGNITSTQTISSSSLISSFGSITNLSSSTLTLTNPLSVIYGGTGKTETPANGQLLIGDSGGYTLSTLTGGTNVSINSSAGYISISSIDTYITGLSFSDSAPNRKLLTITRNNLTPLSNVFSLSASDITTALNYTPLNKSGDTMSGSLLVQSSINATQNITSNTTISAPTLIQNGYGVCDLSGNCLASTQAIVGAGSAGYIPRFLGTYSIADSTLFQDSYSNIGIGGTNPGEKLDVFGAIRLSTDMGTGPRALALYQDQGNLYWNGQAVGVIGGTGPGGIIGQVGYFPFFNTTTSLVNSDFQYISNVNERGLELITTNNIPVYLGIGRSGNETFKMGVASDNSNFFGAGETAEDVVLINQSTNASSDLVFSNIGVQSRFLFKFGPNPNPSEIISMKYNQANTNSRLGINTTDPRSELEVVGSALITDTLAVATFSNPSSTQAFTFLNGGNFNGNLSASNATLNVISGVSLTLSGNAIISGNLGLGNTNPTSRLDMTGNLNLENTSSSTTGVITKNGVSFISNFAHPTGGSATPDGFNTFIGLQSGNFTTGSTASQTNEASRNTALGYQTLKDITTAYENTALGAFALRDLINGYQNTAIGSNALMLSTTAYQNTVLGANALSGLTTGHQNIAIGYSAGRYLSNGSTLNNHSENSIYIGLNTKSKQASSTNEIVIGNSQTGLGDNSIILGNSSNLITALTGNVGLGTTNPSEKLEVVGTIKGDSLNILGTGAINTLTLTNALSPIYGGTGLTQTPASGQILIGNASGGYSLETLLEGTNVDISIASSSVTISSEDRYLTNANFTDSAPNRKVLTLTQVDKTGNTIPAISANFSLSSSDITTALNYTPTNKSGDTMSGPLLVQGNITSTQTMSSSTAIFTRTQTNTFFLKDVSQSNTLQLEANVGSTNRKLILDLNQGTLDNTTLSLKGMQSVNFQSSSNDKNLTFNFISPDQNRTFDVLNQGTLPAINANILDIYNATLSASTFSSPSSNTFNFLNGTVIATTFSGSASGLTSLNAGNLTGTIPSSVLAGSSLFIGTTEIPLNRTSGAQALTGITGISSTTSLSLTAGGSNQNITLTPSGTGYTLLNGNVGLSFTLPQNLLTVGSYNSATSSNLKQGLLSVDNTLLAQLEGGAYFGRVGITENQWGNSNYGLNWNIRESNRNWRSISLSSDGKYQSAVVDYGYIFTSSDFGVTWTSRATDTTRRWKSITMSSDGKIQTAVVLDGNIFTSTDYGVNWLEKENNRRWEGVAMSSDGRFQTAVSSVSSTLNADNIYTSSDYGNTWIPRDLPRSWRGIAMSSDGKIQTAFVNSGKIYTSVDYGATWTERESNRSWISVSMSHDGKRQVAATRIHGEVYLSSDYGNSWNVVTVDTNPNIYYLSGQRPWLTTAMSSDGRVIVVAGYNELYPSITDLATEIFVSSDYGQTWVARQNKRIWGSVGVSSDGKRISAVEGNGKIYVSSSDTFMSEGNVGIGTTSPLTRLHVAYSDSSTAPNTAVTGLFIQNTSTTTNAINGLSFVNAGGFNSASIYTQQANFGNAGDKLFLNTKTSTGSWNTGIVMDTLGNVGIGTTSPNSILNIQKTSAGNVTIGLALKNNSLNSGTGIGIEFNPNQSDEGAQRGARIIGLNPSGGGTGNPTALTFWTNQNASNALERMRIDEAGRIGIGTTNPTFKLDIQDTNTSFGVNIGSSTQTSFSNLIMTSNLGTGQIWKAGSTYGNSWGGNSALNVYNSSGPVAIFSNGSQSNVLFMNNSGNVGIGTTSPSSRLEIAGGDQFLADGDFAARGGGFGRFQNYFNYSEQFENTAWSKESAISVSANSASAPNNTLTADSIIYGSTGNLFFYQIPLSGSAGFLRNRTFTISIWARVPSGTSILTLWMGQSPYKSSNCSLTTSWRRCTFTASFDNLDNSTYLFGLFSGSYNTTYIVWGAQLEESTTPSLYTRTGIARYPAKNLKGIVNGDLYVQDTNQFFVTPNYPGGSNIPAGVLMGAGNTTSLSLIADGNGEASAGVNILAYSTGGSGWTRGLSYVNRSNGTGIPHLSLQQDGGNVGIGTTSPSQALHVVGNARFTSVGSGAFSNNLNIMSDGTLTTSTSDERLKTNLRYLTGTLDKVLQLKPYYFNWIDDVENREDIGLVAQQVEPIIPEIVFTNQTDGFMGINYDKLGVILTVALQEQQTQISTLSQDSLTLSSVSTNLSSAMQSLVTSSSNLESVNGNLSLAMSNLISTQASFELRLNNFSSALGNITMTQSEFSLSLNTLNLKQEELSNAIGSLNLTTFQSMYDSLQNTLDALTMDTLNGELVISSDLLVNGDSIFNNATFTGDVSIGQMSFNTLDNSLNVLGASCVNLDNTLNNTLCTSQTLYVMKNTSGYIDFFDGQITFKPNGDLEVKKVTTEVLEITDFSAPTPTDSCTKGQIKFGEETGISYIYVCTSDNNWKRSELSSY